MIFLPGVLSQDGTRITWKKYAIEYVQTKSGTWTTYSGALFADSFHYMANAYTVSGNKFVLTSPTHCVPRNNFDTYKYMVAQTKGGSTVKSSGTLYVVDEYESRGEGAEGFYAKGSKYTLSASKGDFIEEVKAKDPNTYPDNGAQGGYWYVKVEE